MRHRRRPRPRSRRRELHGPQQGLQANCMAARARHAINTAADVRFASDEQFAQRIACARQPYACRFALWQPR